MYRQQELLEETLREVEREQANRRPPPPETISTPKPVAPEPVEPKMSAAEFQAAMDALQPEAQ
jgi:hypothetical protein